VAYRDTIQAEGTLLNYWPETEASGTSLAQLPSGTAITLAGGALVGQTGQVDGTAVTFDGVDDAGSVAVDYSAHSKLVIELLCNISTYSNDDKLLMEYGPSWFGVTGGFVINANSSDGTFAIGLSGAGGTLALYTFTRPSTGWHSLVAVLDFGAAVGSKIAFYVDGVAQTPTLSLNDNVTGTFANSTLYLNCRNGASNFAPATHQHLAVYSDLSEARMAAHYSAAFGSAAATSYTLSGPSSGTVNAASSNFTLTPNGTSSATVTIARSGGGLTGTQTVTFDGTSAAKTFTITPTAYGTVTLTPTNNGSLTDPAAVTYASNTGTVTVAGTDLWYNGYDGSGNPEQSPFSELRLTTDATTLKVSGTTTLYGSFPNYSELEVFIDGVAQATSDFAANGSLTFTFSGLSSASKNIVVRTGLQSNPSGTVLGTFIDSLELRGLTAYSLTAPVNTGRTLVYCDSIGVGANSDVPATHGWTNLLRDSYHRSIMVEGWGYRALADDVATTGALDTTKSTAFAARIAGYAPSRIVFAIGTNDYGLGGWSSAANFGTALADLIDRVHTALPAARFVLISPIQRISPASETGTITLGNFRTQISAVAAARSSYCTYVEGAAAAIVPDNQIDTDGVHLTTTGHATYAAAVDNALSATPDTTAPVVDSASVDSFGTTLTVELFEANSPPVLPASGVTGFTLTASGGAVTLSSAAISGTEYTATLSRAVTMNESLSLAYAPGNVTDSASPPNPMASFSGFPVANFSSIPGVPSSVAQHAGPLVADVYTY
jgi:lysophospholipase L1-like esterase